MTHAWIAIFRGNFIEATRENFLSLPLFAFSISSLGIYAGGFEYSMKEARRKLLIGCLLALFLLYALARNLKGWP